MCYEQKTISLVWVLPQNYTITHTLHARLISLFSDVICIFADDLGGLEKVADYLVVWVRMGDPSSLPTNVHPRVVIMVREPPVVAIYSVLEMEDLRLQL